MSKDCEHCKYFMSLYEDSKKECVYKYLDLDSKEDIPSCDEFSCEDR